VAVGPGLTTEARPFLRRFLKDLDKPVVVDADALNIVAREPAVLEGVDAPKVITPHPGEAARLLGRDVGDRKQAAADLADRYGCIAVLKGAGTVVSDGERCYVNKTGNPGMATGGTGDVLAGLAAARLAAGADALTAAIQAVFVHGAAGDLAAAATGPHGMIATDLVANIPTALQSLVRTNRKRKR
jgi:NAD(P)H-hydrate epimerase